jgi:hypothetical protein
VAERYEMGTDDIVTKICDQKRIASNDGLRVRHVVVTSYAWSGSPDLRDMTIEERTDRGLELAENERQIVLHPDDWRRLRGDHGDLSEAVEYNAVGRYWSLCDLLVLNGDD